MSPELQRDADVFYADLQAHKIRLNTLARQIERSIEDMNMKLHADPLADWSPAARQHRELVSGKLPLMPMEVQRDPWTVPVIVFAAVIVAYFGLQFLR